MTRRPTDLRSIIRGNGHLQHLLQQADAYCNLTDQVRGLLPGSLAAHLSNAVGRGQVLVLFADSPAWATRLRYTAPALRANLNGFDAVQVKVAPIAGQPTRTKDHIARKAHLGRSAAAQIRAMAEALSDPDLKRTLNRIADHGADEEY